MEQMISKVSNNSEATLSIERGHQLPRFPFQIVLGRNEMMAFKDLQAL